MIVFMKGQFKRNQIEWLYNRMLHAYVDFDCDENCYTCEYRLPCDDIKRLSDYLFTLIQKGDKNDKQAEI